MENISNSVNDLVSYIKSTKEYQTCISLKNKMKNNSEITTLIENIKNTQKKYIRSGYKDDIKEELDQLNNQLNAIPIYSVYLENLDRVNEMIGYVKDRLNQYFMDLYQ